MNPAYPPPHQPESAATSSSTQQGMPLEVLLTRLDPTIPIPAYASPGDAGMDLCTTSTVQLDPGERVVVG
ncbi:MAG: hypothetical protein ACRDRL_21565, partial [Sciscionella sp.]